jgi:uncharacterized membrane protein YeaQ/YmgE (transglycosylase-associated protein family)
MQRELIRYLLIGFVAGWIANILVRGRILRLRGCLSFLIFGIIGAVGGGYLVHILEWSEVAAVVAAALGAVGALLFLQVLRNA